MQATQEALLRPGSNGDKVGICQLWSVSFHKHHKNAEYDNADVPQSTLGQTVCMLPYLLTNHFSLIPSH